MLPQLAFPHRRLPGYDDAPRDAYYPHHHATPSITMRLPPLPYRHAPSPARSSTLAPPQIPYPVESNPAAMPSDMPRSMRTDRQPMNDYRPGNAEHMLRRKTPNGTLAAGYDGTPVHWSSKPSAPKHMLLMASSAPSTPSYPLHGAFAYSETPPAGPSLDPHAQYPLAPDSTPTGAAVDAALFTGGDVANRAFLPPGTFGMNQILAQIQTPLGGQRPRLHDVYIPTVIQPNFPQGPGPTASNDTGYLGQFWPDTRLHPHIRRGASIMPPPPAGSAMAALDLPLSLNAPALHNPHVRSTYGDILQARAVPEPYRNHSLPTGAHSMLSFGHAPRSLLDNHAAKARPAGAPASLSFAGNAQFKERVLSKAHHAYVDLLAFLQQTKKANRDSAARGHSSQSYPRMVIYPKPPRLPAATFSSQHTNSLMTQHLSMHQETSILEAGAHGGIKRPSMANGIVSYPQPDLQRRQALFANAQSCLQILSNLCDESGWRWIDGMLLGGCLSYGLEMYPLAVDWFSKIVALDSSHVEALSNLAIALFAMNRREEAEQHWLRALKIRPSHFEAAEHLVGLLCADGRGHEAIHIISFVERTLRIPTADEPHDHLSDVSSEAERSSIDSTGAVSDRFNYDFDRDARNSIDVSDPAGYGSSGYSISASENSKILALIHAKGNLLYTLGDINGAARAFEDAVLIAAGRRSSGVQGLIRRILTAVGRDSFYGRQQNDLLPTPIPSASPLLLPPDKAVETARLVFARNGGELPGLRYVPESYKKGAISTTSNSLLSLAKIYQDDLTNPTQARRMAERPTNVSDILALYYLSLSLQPSPSTANNVGILLASVPTPAPPRNTSHRESSTPTIPGVVPGSGVALALAYYNFGLYLDNRHAHLYTNLGSLLKDIGQLTAAIKMYEQAVDCDGNFDIALANLANAVKDQGRVKDAIKYYRQAVASNPDFAEAVCGLANALNSVCEWTGRGGVLLHDGAYDRWHVDHAGMIVDARLQGATDGWMKRVVDIVARQLAEGANWGRGVLRSHENAVASLLAQVVAQDAGQTRDTKAVQNLLLSWAGQRWEGARVVRLVERAVKRMMWRWYQDKYVLRKDRPASHYPRPQLPASLAIPSAPTVLPFHTFTCPLSARDVRMISQRNALRISCQALKSSWLPQNVFPPPPPPNPCLNIGYVSSDFNNHPLSHLMQSVFGFHDPSRAKAFCYATTTSDNSIHRQQIEREAPVFHDASAWSAERLIQQIIQDGIHILVNLNGYTRGARNDIFAARPTPIQMSFMGFAGTLGAEWCDYLVADETAIPRDTLRPHRSNVTLEDLAHDDEEGEWVYSENIVFTEDTFFCCDHAQSSPNSSLGWQDEQQARWKMRKELFPGLADDAIILGNFNQLYKIDPTTFRTWLRILSKVPKAILWLLRFPDLGESNLKQMARRWANEEIASRIWFTDVAPKQQHISRARVCDLFLDTAECNAHTTAADVLWSSTPILTLPRYKYKMCSRMAASILRGALPKSAAGERAAAELIAVNDAQYEEFAVKLAQGFSYKLSPTAGFGYGVGRLAELRRLLYDNRWRCGLFDTKRWVGAIEDSYEEAWRKWVADEGGDIFL